MKRAGVVLTAAVLTAAVLPLTAFPVSAKTAVKAAYSFDKLAKGEVTAADIGAIEETNMYFGIDGVPVLSPRGGYEEASAVWKLEAKSGETFESFVLSFVGRTWYQNKEVKDDNYLKVSVSTDGTAYTLVKTYQSNDNADMNQLYQLDLAEYFKGQSTAFVKMEWLVFDSPHIFGIRSIELNGNGNIQVEKPPEPIKTDKKPEECTMVSQFYAFNQLAFGEVEAEEIGAVSESNMYYGIDGVPLLSSRNGYEMAYATWKIEAAEGEPLNDLVLTIVGRVWYMDANQKDNNTLKVLVSVDGKSYTLVKTFHSNDDSNDAQKIVVELTDAIKGYGQAYVQLQWLVFDAPHIIGIRSISLTGNTAGIDGSGGTTSKMPVTNVQSFTSLPVGAVSKEAIGAEKCANLVFGLNRAPLLTAAKSGEDAYAFWKIEAAEGETFDDGYLTLIGKIGYVDAAKKDTSFLKVTISTDGESYSEVQTLKATEDNTDTQKFVMDLTNYIYGCSKAYVKLYWSSEDDPTALGLRSFSLVANAGSDYDSYTPAIEQVELPEETTAAPTTGTTVTEKQPADTNSGLPSWAIVLIVIGGVVVLAGGGVAVWWFVRKKHTGNTPE